MIINLADGKKREVSNEISVLELAKEISPKLASAAITAKVNGQFADLSRKLQENDTVEILTFDSPEGKSVFWHSSSHILAQAVQELFPDAKIAIGPSIESGFYYDFDVEKPFTPDDLVTIEKKVKEIAGKKLPIKRSEPSVDEAREYFQKKG